MPKLIATLALSAFCFEHKLTVDSLKANAIGCELTAES
jgi:hypothetical protein